MVNAKPETIFRIYEDVASWHTWDPDTKKATLEGPLRLGAKGRLTPTKGRAVPMIVTKVTAGRSFTVESKIPLFRMVFEHMHESMRVWNRSDSSRNLFGTPEVILGPMLCKQLDVGLPVTLNKLKQLAECGSGV